MGKIISMEKYIPKEIRFLGETDRGIKVRMNGYDAKKSEEEMRRLYRLEKKLGEPMIDD